MQKFCIYGAGIVAASIYTALKDTYNYIPVAFLVSDRHGNPDRIDGIPVKTLLEWVVPDDGINCLVAVPEPYHSAIRKSLIQKGIRDSQIVFVDNHMENSIMRTFYDCRHEFVTVHQTLDIGGQDELPDMGAEKISSKGTSIEVFQAKSHMDKQLVGVYNKTGYVHPIQVGAALTDQVILSLQDDAGDNISAKNRNYSELTAAYYAWKHSSAGYKGLCHYRRIFDIDDERMQMLMERRAAWDVILPYPSVHYPDISVQHQRYINDMDWDAMLCALREMKPEYYHEFQHVFQGQFFYNFNMLIARHEIFDDYCNFIFSVLGRTEELTEPKGWERSDRFAGYLGENLTTLYFMANKDKLKIIHAGRIWMT